MIISGLKCKVLLIVVSIFFIWGCAKETVIARVNGEAITKKDLNNALRRAGIKVVGDDTHKAMYPRLIDQLIDEKLVLQAAKKENIKIDKKEALKAYNDMVKTFPKEGEYLKQLKEKGLSKIMVLKFIEKDLITEKLKENISRNLNVSDEELKGYYDRHIATFTTTEQVRLSLIKVGSLEAAKKIKKEIEQGANFEDMANRYPAGHVERGGETGWITLDTFPSDMVKGIGKIKTGSFDGPIKGREGYYIIKVQERREKMVKPLDEVRENIKHILLQAKKEEKYRDWLQNTRKNSKIQVLLQKG